MVLEDGSLRAVIMVTSINFALKGESEKNAIVASFSNLLNALNFPIEIVVRSKKLDLDNYLDRLKQIEQTQRNELLKNQIGDYVSFVSSLLEVVNIMDKDFFVVVPFFTGGLQRLSLVDKVLNKVVPGRKTVNQSTTSYEQDKVQLKEQAEQVMSLLSGIGLKSVMLGTEELIELFYTIYNPVTAHNEKLKEVGVYAAPVVGPPKESESEEIKNA